MTALNTRSQATGVQVFTSAVQARTSDLVDFSPGSILRAVAEAVVADELWLQALVVQVLAVTRLTTSFGTDVDSFCVQFMPALPGTQSAAVPLGSPRIQAVAATGLVTFLRNTVSSTAPFIPLGTLVKTGDGTQQFQVYADPTNPAYLTALGGYSLASGTASVTVSVQAVNAGSQGNVSAGTVNLVASTIPSGGVDTVINPAAFTNGVDAESDGTLKARFVAFIASLSKATEGALTYAIQSIQTGLQVAIHEQIDPNGATDYGMVTIYVDDGSGAPPPALITAANNAVGAYRAAGVRSGVYGATTLSAAVVMVLGTAPGFSHSAVVGQVGAAMAAFINSIGLENTLHITQLAAVAYGIPGVMNVSAVTLNGGTADLVPGMGVTIKANSLVIS